MDILSIFSGVLPNLADYIIYGCIAIVTLIGFFKCLIPLWSTSRSLRRAISKLQDHAGTNASTAVWQDSRFVGRRLKGIWQRFLQNAQQLDARRLPCNVEDYINDDTVTHGPGNAPLAELIPNLLTSLGILGTFIGLMRGLTGLDMTDAASLMNGIPILLDGMKFAFGTSVCGIACSLVFNMLNRISVGSSYRAIDDFVENFTLLAMQRPLDNDVQMVCQNEDRNMMLQTVTSGLVDQLSESVESAVSNAMAPVCDSMNRFLAGTTRSQIDGVNRIVGSFVTEMNSALNGQFLQLGQTLSELNQNQRLTMAQMDSSLQTAQSMIDEINRMQGISVQVMDRFQAYVNDINRVGDRDAQFEANSSRILSQMNASAASQSEVIKSLQSGQQQLVNAISDFRASADASMTRMQRSAMENSAVMQQAAGTMEGSAARLSGSYESFVTDVVEGMSKSLSLFNRSMNDLMQEFDQRVQNLPGATSDTTAQLCEIQKLMTSIEQSLRGSHSGKEA